MSNGYGVSIYKVDFYALQSLFLSLRVTCVLVGSWSSKSLNTQKNSNGINQEGDKLYFYWFIFFFFFP